MFETRFSQNFPAHFLPSSLHPARPAAVQLVNLSGEKCFSQPRRASRLALLNYSVACELVPTAVHYLFWGSLWYSLRPPSCWAVVRVGSCSQKAFLGGHSRACLNYTEKIKCVCVDIPLTNFPPNSIYTRKWYGTATSQIGGR